MPDSDGYEILSGSRYAHDRADVLHHPCDTRVPNNAHARKQHLRECTRNQREEARKAEKQRQRDAAANLRQIARLRAESERAYERAGIPAFTPGAHQLTIDPEGDPTK